MDDDDCDIFADVTKFCNSKSLEEEIDKAQIDSADVIDLPPHEFESPSVSPKKVKSTRKGRSSQVKKSPAKSTASKVTRSKAKNVEKASNSQENTQEKTTELASECLLNEFFGGRRGRGARRGRTRRASIRRSLENMMNLIASVNNATSAMLPPPAPTENPRQRGRARRDYMAELAARSNVVGVVDLVTSPSLPLPNLPSTVISVDSDEEVAEHRNLDVSFDTENPEISVKVKWGDGIEVFTYRKYQKFTDLLNTFATREDVPVTDIVLNLGDRIIQPSDTPDSIDYKIYQFISGRIIKDSVNSTRSAPRKKNANEIELRIQSDAWKKPISVLVKKNDAFRILYIKCSEELNVPVDRIKLSFDGDPLDLDSTPNELEMDGEEIIDCRLKR